MNLGGAVILVMTSAPTGGSFKTVGILGDNRGVF